jgi:hypothetical protein
MRRYETLRAFLLLALVAATTLPAARAAEPVPEALAKLYDELRMATETKDTAAIVARFSPFMQLTASQGQGWLAQQAEWFRQRENLAVELKLDDVKVVGDRALVRSTWAVAGRTVETKAPWNTTLQRADWLIKRGADWLLLAAEALDPLGQAKVVEGVYRDEKNGLEAAAPEGWQLVPLTRARAAVVAVSPDLTVLVAWVVTDVPGTFAAEQLLRANQDAVDKLLPTLGINSRDVTFGPVTLAGRAAFRAHRVVTAEGGWELLQEDTFCVAGSTLYAVAALASPPDALKPHQAAVERAVAATKISAPQATELPPEAGRLDGRRYVNDVYGCEATAPEGWETAIQKSDWKFQVTMREPGGSSSIILGMVELPTANITAEQAIQGDDNMSRQIFEQFKAIRSGETTLGGAPAYEAVTQFNVGGQPRRRWRVYMMEGNRLFLLCADASPADLWDRLEKVFRGTMDSFKLTGEG